MEGYQLVGLQIARSLNPEVEMPAKGKAIVLLPNGKPRPIVPSMAGWQFFWGLTDCSAGKHHYRYCTPHTLDHRVCLRCPFCAYDPVVWTAAGKHVIWQSEIYLMWQLGRVQLDQQFCWQVKLRFWAAPFDFMMLSKRVIIQADGSCHFQGMYEQTTGKRLEDDVRFCVQAVEAGLSVVRVHAQQVTCSKYPSYLAAAVQLAAASQCVVLSSGYSIVYIYESGKLLTYAELLSKRLAGFRVYTAAFGNIVICKQ